MDVCFGISDGAAMKMELKYSERVKKNTVPEKR